MHINKKLSSEDGDWMPYHKCFLVAAFVIMVSCLANSIIVLILILTRPLLKFVSVHIGSNYLCTKLETGSLALSNGSHFSSTRVKILEHILE